MRRSVVVGADLDGTSLRIVSLSEGRVVGYESLEVVSVAAAAVALQERIGRRSSALVSWSSPGASMRRASLADVRESRLVPSIREAIESQIPGGASLPGAGCVRSHGSHGSHRSAAATVGAITADSSWALRDGLSGTNARIVMSAFTFRHDGLHLALRGSGAELTLVSGGAALVTRQLRCGGLSTGWTTDALAAALPPDVLLRVAAGDHADATHLAVARRYVASLVREVLRTVEHWQQSGDNCPREMWVHGPGAALPHLPSFLLSVGLAAKPAPIAAGLDVGQIPAEERLAAYGALCAATVDLEAQPYVDLSKVKGDRRQKDRRMDDPFAGFQGVLSDSGARGFARPTYRSHRETLPTGLGALLIVGTVAMLGSMGAWWKATSELDSATAGLNTAVTAKDRAQANLNWSTEVEVAASEVRRLSRRTSPGWDAVVTNLLSYLPAEPAVRSLRFAERDANLVATIRVPAAPGVEETWSSALESLGPTTVMRMSEGSDSVLVLTVELAGIDSMVVES